MTRRELHELGELQRAVIEVLWGLGEGTVNDVRGALRREELAYTTILTVLQKLQKAGWVDHRKEGRSYVWRAAESREAVGRSSIGKFVDRVFSGSPRVALEHLLEDDRLDSADLEALQQLIDAKRRGKEEAR